jgi:nitrogen fixation protein FixH
MFAKKGQSIVEYVVLFGLVVAALLIMHIYVKRAYQGRIKQGSDEISQQYSPGHTTSLIETQTNSNSTTCTGGTCFGKDIPDNMTVTQSSSTNTYTRKEGIDSFATE